MYAFSTLAQGRVMLPAAIERGKAVRVFIINKSLHSGGVVAVRASEPTVRAVLLTIDAPALDSNAVSFGGTTFDNDTGFLRGTPQTVRLQQDPSGEYRFMLGNASMAVLTVQL